MDKKTKAAESAYLLIEDLLFRCGGDWPKELGYSNADVNRIYRELAEKFGFSTVSL